MLSIGERWRALAWIEDGRGLREVARRLAVSPSVIHRLKDRFEHTGIVDVRINSGRPRATTQRQDRFIAVSAVRNRTVTANQLRTQLLTATNINVSVQTIRNRLHEVHIRSRRPAIRTPLTVEHRAARLAWCRHHVTWTREQWAKVLFSDESRFTMSFNDGRIHVWRRRGERFNDACVREHDHYGGGSTMVWGGISLNHRTRLHRVQGNLTGVNYRDDILQPIVLPILRTIGHNAILQDDNARPHRARVVNEFMQHQQVVRMDWPARSPDLNPIEHLWDVLGRRLRMNPRQPNNLTELFQNLQQEWESIPQETVRRLIGSMRSRCMSCIEANGGHTRF